MKMGIEKVLKEKFGDAVKDIRQVDGEQIRETTVEVSFFPTLVSEDVMSCGGMLSDLNFLMNKCRRSMDILTY